MSFVCPLEWGDRLRVGVPLLDKQRADIVRLMTELFEGMSGGRGRAALLPLLDRLLAAMHEHFKTQEDYLRQVGFTDTDAHQHEHELVMGRSRELVGRFKAYEIKLTLATANLIGTWIKNHFENVDRLCHARIAQQAAEH